METSWQATLLGRGPGERGGALGLAGAQVGTGTATIHRLLQVVAARPSSIGQAGWAWRRRSNSFLELERHEVQELPMLLRPGSVGDGGAEEPEEHEQLSAGTAGRGRHVDGLRASCA